MVYFERMEKRMFKPSEGLGEGEYLHILRPNINRKTFYRGRFGGNSMKKKNPSTVGKWDFIL